MERTLNILVVDDEQIVLDSIKKHLKKDNFTIHSVLSAQAGLDTIGRESIDIVLTDLMMPDIDGLEFMKLAKEQKPHIPIIMITGYATINTALQATQLGAFDYIAKPFTKTELKSVIKRASEMVLGTVDKAAPEAGDPGRTLKTVGENVWIKVEPDGIVVLGVERAYLQTIGKIQSVYLPEQGDELRQGSVYLQIISADLRSHTIMSPLSGTVVEINYKVLDDPVSTLEDPYDEGWLIRLKPSRFENEIEALGL